MGHANLTNLSRLFIDRLYAKGKLSVREAVEVAIAKGEEVQASEGGYGDEGTLSMAIEQIVDHLGRGRVDVPGGPFIRPLFEPTPPGFVAKDPDLKGLIAAARERPDDATTWAVMADRFQELGRDEWAAYVRRTPARVELWTIHCDATDSQNWDWNWDDPDNEFSLIDSIWWVFAEGWRKRYRNVPLLGWVTN